MNRKEKLISRIAEIRIQENLLSDEKVKLQRELNEISYGVKVGDDIMYEGKKCKITSFWSDMAVRGKVYKKDGSLGVYEKYLWSIHKKEEKK